MNLAKAIELNKESADSLRQHKFIDHADAILIGIEAIRRVQRSRDKKFPIQGEDLPGEDSKNGHGLTPDAIKRVRESPLAELPKPTTHPITKPATITTLDQMRLSALHLYRDLTHHSDRQPRYTLLTFAGATPQQAQKWRDWSTKHFAQILDYLFNPEPLADGLVNNRLGSSEEGLKSLAVA